MDSIPLLWKARRIDDGMLFFISNFKSAGTFEATLRVAGMVPELFDPVTGQITELALGQVALRTSKRVVVQ